jgi:hypothetical protein
MSEYQYYEWQTIDRPLSPREWEDVSGLSSHMETVTPTQAIVTYSWGDFKHDPRQVLLKYFDAHLYMANWGTRRLLFRFPKSVIDSHAIRPYCREEFLTLELKGNYYILEFSLDDEEPDYEWLKAEGMLGKMAPIREQIMQGDYRALYLSWLKAVSIENPEEDNPETEPPIPAGLGKLNSSHQAFIEFFELDEHLVKAAAKASPPLQSVSVAPLEKALAQLNREECENFLRQVLNNEPQVRMTLQKQLEQLAGIKPVSAGKGQRQAGNLFKEAERLEQEALRQQKAEAERKRIKELLDLAEREEATWRWVESLIGQKQARPYDEATKLLVDLRDLAIYQNRQLKFQERFSAIREKYSNRPTLMGRFTRAGL